MRHYLNHHRTLFLVLMITGLGCNNTGDFDQKAETDDSLLRDLSLNDILTDIEWRRPITTATTTQASFAAKYAAYSFEATQGGRIAVDVIAVSDSSHDPVIWLFQLGKGGDLAQAKRIAYADDKPGSLNPHVELSVPETGSYLLVIREYRLRRGQFRLQVSCISGHCECPAVDKEPPTVVSVEFFPSMVDVSNGEQTVEVSVTTHDDLSGIEQAEIFLVTPDGWFLNLESQWPPKSYLGAPSVELKPTTDPNRFEASFQLGRFMKSGTYQIHLVSLWDHSGAHNAVTQGSFPFPHLEVVNNGENDVKAPSIESITLSSTVVEVGPRSQTIEVQIAANDDISGVDKIAVRFGWPDDQGGHLPPEDMEHLRFNYLQLSKVLNRPNLFSGTLEIPRYMSPGEYALRELFISDHANNAIWLNAFSYNPSELKNIKFSVKNSGLVDTVPPTVRQVRLSTSSIDPSRNQDVIVEVEANDNLSGIYGPVHVVLQSFSYPSQSVDVIAYPTSADRYRGVLHLNKYTSPNHYYVYSVWLTDEASNVQWYSPQDIISLEVHHSSCEP